MNFLDLLIAAHEFFTSGSAKAAIFFVEKTASLLGEKSISKVERRIGKAHVSAALETAETIQYEKDQTAAINRILTDLEQGYQIYYKHWKTMPKTPDIPYVWIPFFIAELICDTYGVEEAINSICYMIAVYHRVLNDSDELVERWLFEKPIRKTSFIFYSDRSTEKDQLEQWLLGDRLTKQYAHFIKLHGERHPASYYYDPGEDQYDAWMREL